MREKLKQSAKSTNFWNNISNVFSGLIFMGMLYLIDDPEFTKQLVFAYISSSGMYNAGNILAHVNKDN